MGKIRQYWLLTALLIVAILGAGYFVGVKQQSAQASSVKAQTATQRSANDKLANEIQTLKTQGKDLVSKENERRQIAMIIPGDPAIPGLVYSLSGFVASSGVALTAVTPGLAVAMPDPDVAAKAAAAQAAAAKSAAEGKPSDAKTPASAPVGTATWDLAALPVTLTLKGDFTQLERFLAKLEQAPRAFVVDTLTVSTNPPVPGVVAKTADLTVNIVGRVFYKNAPATPAAPVKATAAPTTQK